MDRKKQSRFRQLVVILTGTFSDPKNNMYSTFFARRSVKNIALWYSSISWNCHSTGVPTRGDTKYPSGRLFELLSLF